MNHLEGLKGGTLALVDNNPANLERMGKLANLAAKTSHSGTVVETYENYRDALPGADFVILSFAQRNAYYRKIDCTISAKYGIRMCSGDTIGPGGIFRAMRDFPHILEVAHAVEEICPDAWLINYINPSATMGIGLFRHSRAKSFALCDSHHLPNKKLAYLEMLGKRDIDPARFEMKIAGVNHFTWMLEAKLDGQDVLRDIHESFRARSLEETNNGYAKARFNNYITAHLADVFGAIPTCTGHSKEYVPYYQGRSPIQEAIPPLEVFDCDERMERTAKMWQDVDDYLSGSKPMEDFHTGMQSDHATDIINTMVVEDGRNYYINRTNTDCVDGGGRPVGNLPEDAFLEMECKLDRNGPKPLHVGNFPIGLRSQQMLIQDVHELTIEAIVKKDRNLLVRAMAMDPLVNSIATAEAVIDELIEAEKEALPGWSETKSGPKEIAELGVVGAAPQLY